MLATSVVTALRAVRLTAAPAAVPGQWVLAGPKGAAVRLGLNRSTLARASAGKAPKEVGELLHAATVSLFEQACELMESA